MRKLRIWSLIVAGVACTPPTAPAAAKGSRVEYRVIDRELSVDEAADELWAAGKTARFTATGDDERAALADLVPRLLAGARGKGKVDPRPWEATAYRAGFRVERWRVGGHDYLALVERPEQRRGAGAYVFRVAPASEREILLEAPHAYHDVGTDVLAARLFFAPPAGPAPRALFTNTIHRYRGGQDGKKLKEKNAPADVAHSPGHGFTAATLAFARAAGRVLVVQLHGFGEGEAAPAGTAVVISAGDARGSSPRSRAVAGRLTGFAGVKRFPEDVQVLGATTNVQAQALAGLPGAEFVHVELSATLRGELVADPARLAELGRALFGDDR